VGDVLSLVSGKLSSEKVTINDSSPDSAARIRLVFDKGQLVEAEPESAIVFMGGG
jgi:hypothetical protein